MWTMTLLTSGWSEPYCNGNRSRGPWLYVGSDSDKLRAGHATLMLVMYRTHC
jgi:hypothetical protein